MAIAAASVGGKINILKEKNYSLTSTDFKILSQIKGNSIKESVFS